MRGVIRRGLVTAPRAEEALRDYLDLPLARGARALGVDCIPGP